MIRIIDCGSQLTQNIARRVRELGVFSEIVPFYTPTKKVLGKGVEGLIISGGQFSVHDNGAPLYSKELLRAGLPVLGICYGQQSIAHLEGGLVRLASTREYGQTSIEIKDESPLFEDVLDKDFSVWMSHGDVVLNMPQGYMVTAMSSNGHIAAIENPQKRIYAVQFHPEVDHTTHGRKILNNFLNICNAQRTWDPTKDYERILEETKEKIAGKIGIGGISGGVDSTAASIFVGKIAGANYHPIFVDNGLLRMNEAEEVRNSLRQFQLNVKYIDASLRFLTRLAGVSDPDEKRKIIGHQFISVFEEAARGIQGASYLVQGTLYPDVVESVPIYGTSSKIKRHHNVGGLPEKLGFELVEPFRNMFKDEVRSIARNELDMPPEIVWRHPFPGPGLAIRAMGEITEEKLRILREADHIFIDELRKRGLYDKISQAFAGITDTCSVGVMGDGGTYKGEIRLRAVVTDDFMTSQIYPFEWNDLQAITNRIINEVDGVGRVLYDTTQKPPATIEWE